jgi:hypothetical protein
MKFHHTVLLLSAALLPCFALAGGRGPHKAPPRLAQQANLQRIAQDVGLVDAVVEFCSKVEPMDKAQFERKGRQMLPRMSQDSLEAARRSSEYHAARGFLQPVLEGLSTPDAVHNCLAVL